MEIICIFQYRWLSEEGCGKSGFRVSVNFHWCALLLNLSCIGNDDLICHFNGFILIMSNKNTGDTQFLDHLF